MNPEPKTIESPTPQAPALSTEEVSALVRSRQILKAHGLPAGYSVKDVSDWAGISRKTAYAREARERQEFEAQRAEHEKLRSEVQRLRQECEMNHLTIRRQERDIGALELTKRAYQELKKNEEQESPKAKHRR